MTAQKVPYLAPLCPKILAEALTQYACNESVASKNTYRQADFTMHALYSHAKAKFPEEQREMIIAYFSLQQHNISTNIYAKYENTIFYLFTSLCA